MKLGILTSTIVNNGADEKLYVDVAKAADELKFDSLWQGHHVAFQSEIERSYPYTLDAGSHQAPDGHRMDPFVLFSHLAAHTTKLRFGVGVFVLPMINPFVTARALTTADTLSGGRMIFGVGVGWNRAEFKLLDAPFEHRGERTDEIIELLRTLFTVEHRVDFKGKYYSFENVEFQPKPRQKPYPPMIYGGALRRDGTVSTVGVRRAARMDGIYLPPNCTPESTAAVMSQIRAIRDEVGLEVQGYEVIVSVNHGLQSELIERYEGLGVTSLLFDVGIAPFDAEPQHLPLVASALIENLAQARDLIPATPADLQSNSIMKPR